MLSRRDRMIPWYFVIFFMVLAIVDGVMATLAVRTQTGLVTDHPYEKGLAYNRTISAADKQRALGWKGDVHYANGKLFFILQDAKGNTLKPQHISATIMRPTQAKLDFSLELQTGGTSVTFPQPGLWEVEVNAQVDGTNYQQSQRIVVP